MNTRLLVLALGVVAMFWAVSKWRLAIRAAMVMLIIEGAIRKWVVPGAEDLVYFAKDALLLGAYVGFLGDEARRRLRVSPSPFLTTILVAAVAFGTLQMFNPSLPSILVGVLGLKAYFLYAPLLYVLPAAFDSDRELARFLRRYSLAAIPIGLLAILQFFSSGSSAINMYARGTDVMGFGSSEHIRVTGTFSYISGYTAYLLASAILLLGILATTTWTFRRQILVFASLSLTILGMLTTGSKGPIFMLAALLPFYFVLAVVREEGRGTTLRLLVGLAIVASVVAGTVPDAVDAWRGRARGSGADAVGRSLQILTAPMHALELSGALGYGIGSTHNAAPALMRSRYAYWLPPGGFEAETGRVMVELGPLGFTLVFLLRFAVIGFAFNQILALRTRFHRAMATAAFLFALAQLTGAPIFDPVANLYFWFFAGLVTTVMRLERFPAAMPAAAPPPSFRPLAPAPLGTRQTALPRAAES